MSNARIANQDFYLSAFENRFYKNQYVRRLLMICLSRFKWNGLPKGIDERYLEYMLCTTGTAIIFFNEELNRFFGLGCAYESTLNEYGVPIYRQPIAQNGFYFPVYDESNSVLIYNNRLQSSDVATIESYAERLWNVERSLIANTNQQKYMSLIVTDEKQRLTWKNLMEKFDGNQPLVYGAKNLNLDDIKVMNLNVPFVAPDILPIRNSIYNDALTELGVVSTTSEKRARLSLAEAYGEFGALELIRDSYLSERKKACDILNDIYGLNVSVEFNSEIPINPTLEIKGEDENNGSLYNSTENYR